MQKKFRMIIRKIYKCTRASEASATRYWVQLTGYS